MAERRRYPSDLSDARWELVEPVLTAWRAERRGRGLDIGRPPDHDLRSLLDTILYVNRTGIPWRYLPHDYPHWNTVYAYFARWQEEGVFDQFNNLLRRQVRRQEGQEAEPSACVIDSQSIKTSTNVPAAGQGVDAGKRIVGRKRSIVIDTVGLLLGYWSRPRAFRTPSPARPSSRRWPPSTPPSARPGSTAATASTSSGMPRPWASHAHRPP